MLLLCLVCLSSYGQVLNFKHIGIEEGLSNSTIECIFQDYRGFIWFGTRDGLNRYDGKQITVYKKTADSNSISDNYIRCIYERDDHTLWIGTSNGLNMFNPELHTFKRYSTANTAVPFISNTITSIEENAHGLWVGTYGGLKLLHPLSGEFKTYTHEQVNDLYTDKEGYLWVARQKGLSRLNITKGKFKHLNLAENSAVRTITPSPAGDLWLGTEDQGMIFLNIQNYTTKNYRHEYLNINSLGSDQVRAIVYDSEHQLWIGGINGGLNRFDPQAEKFLHYQNEPGNSSSLSQRTVSALFEDNQGNLWVGTHRGGINLYSPQSGKFRLIRQEPYHNSLSYNDVRAFNEDRNGNLWIGTDGGGLNYYDRRRNTFKHYRYSPLDSESIGADAVLDIMRDHDSQLFIGTWGGGLNLMDTETGRFKRYIHNPDLPGTISSNYVQKSFEDSRHNLWICTYYGGLNLFNKHTGQFQRLINGEGNTRLIGNNIISINEDRQGNLWIGTDDGGLNCYHLDTKMFSHYFLNEQKNPDLRVIFIDSKGRLWIGQTGLYLFDAAKKRFALYTSRAGLASDFIKGIMEDGAGNFWISTSMGITRFNAGDLSFKKFNSADGLQGLEFEANAFLKSRSGEMFFGGLNGFNAFFPQEIRTNKFMPPVYFTEFKVMNDIMLPGAKGSPLKKDIGFTTEINLRHNQSTFSFSFAGLNYTASENNNYVYQLVGFDKGWVYAGKSGKASYTNLDPGSYVLKVRSSNNDHVWNNRGRSIAINIAPPFYATWWFRLVVTGVISYIAYILLSLKRRLVVREVEERKREEMHQIQLQLFTNISHEFRTPLSLILGPIEHLLKEDSKTAFKNYYKTIHRNARRLLSLINELMDFRKIESGALRLRVIQGNLSLFIDEVAEEFREMAIDKNVRFDVKKNGSFNAVWFDRHIIEKIVLNLINNSLKYTQPGGSLSLEIWSTMEEFNPRFANALVIQSNYKAENYIYIRVADTGIGISKDSINHLFERYYRITDSHLGSGVGLAFVKSLALLHKGKIYVSSEKSEGTEIIIALPCDKHNYDQEELWEENSDAGGIRLESISYKDEPEPEPESEPGSESESVQDAQSETADPDKEMINLKRHILIVDDNEELRTFLKEVLSQDYHVSEAADGHAGLTKVKEENPDLIISDVMMPCMDGKEFCRLLKDDIEVNHIPFLMLTAKNSVEAEIEGIASGADIYFSKPININLLKISLRKIFDQRQKLKEHYSKNHLTELRDLVHSTKDRQFMDKLLEIVNAHLVNPDLDIEFLCSEMGMSRTKLYQKINAITGQSIGELIRSIRLRRALEIMTQEDVLLTEVMYRIGIQTQSYFTKAFKKEFGKTPTQYLQELNQKKEV